MKVTVVFEFEEIEPESVEALYILQQVNKSCETMRVAFGASDFWANINEEETK